MSLSSFNVLFKYLMKIYVSINLVLNTICFDHLKNSIIETVTFPLDNGNMVFIYFLIYFTYWLPNIHNF